MFAKLLKHEFKATAKIMLPLYAAAASITLVARLLMELNATFKENRVIQVISTLFLVLNILLLVGLVIATIILAVMRFYKNMLGDEGYLTFTLPVSPTAHLAARLTTSTVWTVCSGIFSLFAIIALTFRPENFGEWIQSLGSMFQDSIMLILVIFVTILCILCNYLLLYFSMSMGAQFLGNRLLASIITYVLLCIALQLFAGISIVGIAVGINTCFTANSGTIALWANSLSSQEVFRWMFFGMSLIMLLYDLVFFLLTRFLLTKKLNLG